MSISNLEKLAEVIISECKKGEPCDVEVCAGESQETRVVFEQTDFSVSTSSYSTSVGIRAINDGRVGFVTTNTMDEKQIKEKAREAMQVAKLSPQNKNYKIAPKQSGSFELYDPKLAELSPKELLKFAQGFVDQCRNDKRVLIDRIEMTLSTSSGLVFNSNGTQQKVKQTMCNWYVMGMSQDGGEVTSFDYDGDNTWQYSDIEKKANITANVFKDSVVGSLGAKTAKSYQGPVLFHPAAVADLLMGVVGFNVNARAQQDGMSKWKDMVGKSVASELLTLTENPLDKTRAGTWNPFDREGVLTKTGDVIKNGNLMMTAHNMFTSARAGVEPTGHASGGSRSLPGIGLHALSVKKGNQSLQQLYQALNTGLVLKRFSGNEDPVSGEFSGVAKNSWWVENGERAQALKEVMISGNMFDLLKNIKLIGSDIFTQSGSFESPYILVDNVSVTSA